MNLESPLPAAPQEIAVDAGERSAGLVDLRSESVLLAMYSSLPEPPTLNAILMLKRCFGRVVFLRSNLTFPADYYLDTPELKEIGSPCASRAFIRKERALEAGAFRALRLGPSPGTGTWNLSPGGVARLSRIAGIFPGAEERRIPRPGVVYNSYDVIDRENVQPGRFSATAHESPPDMKSFCELDFFLAADGGTQALLPAPPGKAGGIRDPQLPGGHLLPAIPKAAPPCRGRAPSS